ncbi:Phage protein GP46 [compost metagenome]
MRRMDAAIDPRTRDLSGQRTDTLANAVYLRLTVPLGSWFADPALGSRLYELERSKDLSRIGVLACQYAEEALEPLTKDGRAQRIEVSVDQPGNGWLTLRIEVLDAGGRIHTFQHPVRVI